MAVRFDAVADRLLRTTDLLDYNATYTWMAWIYLVSDLNAISTFYEFNTNDTSNGDVLRTPTDGTTLRLNVINAGAPTSADGTNLSVATWYHLAMVRESATSCKVYLNGVLDITNTRDITGRTAATRMEHGARLSTNTNRSDSRVAAIKAWSTNLTQAEIQNEIYTIRPQKTASLYGFWPCFPGATERLKDYSGNGRNWTEAGTLTDEDPPAVSWGEVVWLVSFQAPAGPAALTVSASETITLTESVTVITSAPQVVASETVTLSETVAVVISTAQVSVSEMITLTEAAAVAVSNPQVSASETITLSETNTLNLVSLVSASETVTLSETVSQQLLIALAASEAITLTEGVTIAPLLLPGVSVGETITLTELATVVMVGVLVSVAGTVVGVRATGTVVGVRTVGTLES